MLCSLCGTDRDSEKVEKTAEAYICASCVQLLLNESPEKLQKAYALAVEKGYRDKAQAIQSFIMEENTDEPVNRHLAKRLNRKRPVRTFGDEERTGSRFKKPARPSLYQIEQREAPVF